MNKIKSPKFYAPRESLSKAPEYRRMKLSQWELHAGFLEYFKSRWILHCSSPLVEQLLKAGPREEVRAIISFQNHLDGTRHAVAQLPYSLHKRIEAAKEGENTNE